MGWTSTLPPLLNELSERVRAFISCSYECADNPSWLFDRSRSVSRIEWMACIFAKLDLPSTTCGSESRIPIAELFSWFCQPWMAELTSFSTRSALSASFLAEDANQIEMAILPSGIIQSFNSEIICSMIEKPNVM